MKNLNIYSLMILSFMFLIFQGCNDDFLETVNPNSLTPEQFWQNEEDVEKALIALYATLQTQQWEEQWDFNEMYHMSHEAKSDMVYWDIWQPMQSIARYDPNPNQYMTEYLWRWLYQTIFTANQLLENIDRMVEDGKLDSSKRDIFAGEAKFARAHALFVLLKDFGAVPMPLEVPQTSEGFYKGRSTKDEIWTQIESDLNDAKKSLPSSWSEEWLGRATKGAATAYLGKTYLFQEKWTEAIAQLNEVTTMGYALVEDYESLFSGLNKHSSESLFEINFTSVEDGGGIESTNISGVHSWESNWVTDWGKQLFLSDTTSTGNYTQRVYASVLFDDPNASVWYYNGKTYRQYFDEQGRQDEDRMFWRKWVVNRDYFQNRSKSDINYFIIRYADVILMLAEAENELGNTSEAINRINEVRARAGSALISGMNQNEVRGHIRNVERPLEFVLEATRFDDLVRWYGKDGGVKTILENHNRYGAENFINGTNEIWPIPQIELDANPDLDQNPNY
ncbi:RagB/SusD family nutrient uptake outer membrane protein [Arenibacter sp. S6351L]|uniref:RagB/SusD family nutrient uptake outer membrane protein n=1 Tax=Arenibacter sp. S6351L TaxID=2926407 RepID=UPI001FF15B9D|nr:RagB/SusD family nutrient uptake outer membrane protein [Arenibacter sp. S6351L]MCK0136037.1 RagB/SusD family nutrient uptake outer membrane protein [Arenibacter sp. S6351L]